MSDLSLLKMFMVYATRIKTTKKLATQPVVDAYIAYNEARPKSDFNRHLSAPTTGIVFIPFLFFVYEIAYLNLIDLKFYSFTAHVLLSA